VFIRYTVELTRTSVITFLVAVGNFTISSAELCKDLIHEKALPRYMLYGVQVLSRIGGVWA